jgi:hypothetical protein
LGALPIIDVFLGRIGLRSLLERYLAPGDERVTLPAAHVIGVLVRNLCVAREPLYGLAEWAERFDPGCWVWHPVRRRCSTTTASAARSISCSTPTAARCLWS